METNGWINWLINLKISHWVLWKWRKSPLKSRDITLPTKSLSRQGYGFSSGHIWMWELDGEESWMPKNWCFWTVVLEKTEVLATSCEELTHWERPWCWKGLGARAEGDEREWDGWMASPTWWTWVWVNSGSWWCTGRPAVLRFMGSQRVGNGWVTELNWTEWEEAKTLYSELAKVKEWAPTSCILADIRR